MAEHIDTKDPFGANENFGIPRQHTRVKVLVHSHIINNDLNGIIDCSNDCIKLDTSKTIKGGGSANFDLVARRNYLNYLFPNDWVNIYIDPGDGRGFIRTFFGFIDRIERAITTNDDGATSTFFNVTCSDFTKAFEATQIYFNPHVAKRDDFVGRNFAGTSNLGGAALRTKGIVVYGSPADIVLNLAHLLLGFNAQWTRPKSYPGANANVGSSINARKEWAKSIQGQKVQELQGRNTLSEWIDFLNAEAEKIAQEWKQKRDENQVVVTDDTYEETKIEAIKGLLDQFGLPETLLLNPEVRAGVAVEAMASSTEANSLMEMIDISFVEHKAIDGSIVSAPIWTQQGTLWSMMNSYSNDIVNELFCDLRPLSKDYHKLGVTEGDYSYEPDEHGANVVLHEDKPPTPAVRFVPALVMREYPHSTVHGVDAYNLKILEKRVKSVLMGAIFSQEPNKPGRKTCLIRPVLNDFVRLVRGDSASTKKHLDVSVLSIKDIISENLGRGDQDTVNLIELYSDGFMGKHMKFMTQELQPIPIPISISRHGLRVRTYNTRFARFSSKVSNIHGVDDVGTRRKLVRWVMMLDHWYQHNVEYLNGTIVTRAFPEIRVGYRLDIAERNESYYVEGVNHNWTYPNAMTTTFTLSRGQRNDPFPVYIKPTLALNGNRKETGRLAQIFRTRDPDAVKRALQGHPSESWTGFEGEEDISWTDDPTNILNRKWAGNVDGYLTAGSDEPASSIILFQTTYLREGQEGPPERTSRSLSDAEKILYINKQLETLRLFDRERDTKVLYDYQQEVDQAIGADAPTKPFRFEGNQGGGGGVKK